MRDEAFLREVDEGLFVLVTSALVERHNCPVILGERFIVFRDQVRPQQGWFIQRLADDVLHEIGHFAPGSTRRLFEPDLNVRAKLEFDDHSPILRTHGTNLAFCQLCTADSTRNSREPLT